MANITQEMKVQNDERKCIELARCPKGDKVVYGKQMKGYGMRMPEGLGFCDAIDWIAEYVNKVYGPDAIDVTVRIRALERSDVGYRPMLIQSEDESRIEKAELGMNDTFLPDGSPASKCPFHIHLRMNELMAEDFEELGDNFTGSAAPATEIKEDATTNNGCVDIIEGIASIDPTTKSVRTVLDFSFLDQEGQDNGADYPTTELLIRCPDPHLALDIIEIVEDSVLGYEPDDGEIPEKDTHPLEGEELKAAMERAKAIIQHTYDHNAAVDVLNVLIEIYDDAAQERFP